MTSKTIIFVLLFILVPFARADQPLTTKSKTQHIKQALKGKGDTRDTWFTENGYQFTDIPFEYSFPLAMLNPMCLRAAIDIVCADKIDASQVSFVLHKKQNPDALIEARCITVWYLNLDAQLNHNYLADKDKLQWRFNQDQGNITEYKHLVEISDCEVWDDPMLEIDDHVYAGRTPLDRISSGFLQHEWKTTEKLEFE